MVHKGLRSCLSVEASSPFLIFGLSGLVSVLLDFDHFVALAWWRYVDSTLQEGRIFHIPVVVASGIVLSCVISCLGGLYLKLVLGKGR